MADDAGVAQCAAPHCGQPLTRAASGRRPRYRGPNCRQAARRARVRAQEEAAMRAARLAEARDTASRLYRPMEAAGLRGIAELAALVLACAVDLERPRAELHEAITDLHAAADELASMAREYRGASELARQLADS